MNELPKLNKINFNLKKYQTPKEVDHLIKNGFEHLFKYNQQKNIFSPKFLEKNILINFSIEIDGVSLFKHDYYKQYFGGDTLIPNFDLLDYLFLDYTLGYKNINFYTCSCGYPECGGFYGIPYVIFNSGGDTLVQMLLDESNGYGVLINNLKNNQSNYNQYFVYDHIIQSDNEGVTKIQEHLKNPSEDKVVLTFNYKDFISFQNKIMEIVKGSKNIITMQHLIEEEGYLEQKESEEDEVFYKNKDIKTDLLSLAKREKRFIKKFSIKSKVSKKIRQYLNTYFKKHGLDKNLLFLLMQEKEFLIFNDNKVSLNTYHTNIMSMIFNKVFDRINPFDTIYLKNDRRKLLKNWKNIEKEIDLFLSSLNLKQIELLKEMDVVEYEFLKDIVTDKNLFQKWLKEYGNLKDIDHQENYQMIQGVFKSFEKYTKEKEREIGDYIEIQVREELIKFFDIMLNSGNILFSSLNKNTTPDWMEEGEREFNILLKR